MRLVCLLLISVSRILAPSPEILDQTLRGKAVEGTEIFKQLWCFLLESDQSRSGVLRRLEGGSSRAMGERSRGLAELSRRRIWLFAVPAAVSVAPAGTRHLLMDTMV